MFFWLAEGKTFLDALYYSVRTLSMNSPDDELLSVSGKIFSIIYILIGCGVYITFILEAAKTIISAHHDFEKKQAERKALRKAKKEAKKSAGTVSSN
jgi:predicted membrane protein